jgi:hypothetical protein
VGRELNTHSLTFPGMGKRQGGTFDRKERALAAAVAAGKKGKKEEGKKKQASKQASEKVIKIHCLVPNIIILDFSHPGKMYKILNHQLESSSVVECCHAYARGRPWVPSPSTTKTKTKTKTTSLRFCFRCAVAPPQGPMTLDHDMDSVQNAFPFQNQHKKLEFNILVTQREKTQPPFCFMFAETRLD